MKRLNQSSKSEKIGWNSNSYVKIQIGTWKITKSSRFCLHRHKITTLSRQTSFTFFSERIRNIHLAAPYAVLNFTVNQRPVRKNSISIALESNLNKQSFHLNELQKIKTFSSSFLSFPAQIHNFNCPFDAFFLANWIIAWWSTSNRVRVNSIKFDTRVTEFFFLVKVRKFWNNRIREGSKKDQNKDQHALITQVFTMKFTLSRNLVNILNLAGLISSQHHITTQNRLLDPYSDSAFNNNRVTWRVDF